jgi:hypothetical protein
MTRSYRNGEFFFQILYSCAYIPTRTGQLGSPAPTVYPARLTSLMLL